MAKNHNSERAQRNHQSHFARANLYVELANKTEQGLSNTLFLVATVFLGLTSPLVTDMQDLPDGLKVILFISWILTVASIIAGLIQTVINLNFFAKAFKLSNEQEGIWANMPEDEEEYDKIAVISDKKVDEAELQSTLMPLGIQATCMVLAILFAIVVGGFALFSKNDKVLHSPKRCGESVTRMQPERMKLLRCVQ